MLLLLMKILLTYYLNKKGINLLLRLIKTQIFQTLYISKHEILHAKFSTLASLNSEINK